MFMLLVGHMLADMLAWSWFCKLHAATSNVGHCLIGCAVACAFLLASVRCLSPASTAANQEMVRVE